MAAFACALGVCAAPDAAWATQLSVVVNGLELKGRVRIAVVDAAGWEGKSPSLASVEARVTKADMRFVLEVPEGTAAIRLHHDENGNGELDRNLLGIPSEGYGFSNNPKSMGPPSFKDAAFLVQGETQTSVIEVR